MRNRKIVYGLYAVVLIAIALLYVFLVATEKKVSPTPSVVTTPVEPPPVTLPPELAITPKPPAVTVMPSVPEPAIVQPPVTATEQKLDELGKQVQESAQELPKARERFRKRTRTLLEAGENK